MNERIKTMLWAAVLSLAAVFGGMGCLVSGFSMEPIHAGVVLCWILAAVVFSVCFSYRIGLYPILGLVLLGGFLWYRGYLSQSMELLLQELFDAYDAAYGWGSIRWSDASLSDVHTGTALCWLGLPVIISTAWAVVRRSDTWLSVICAVLPLGCCMVVTDAVPEVLPLFVLLATVLLLMMTQTVRHRDEEQGNRLTMLLVLPVTAVLGLLFLTNPKESYDRQDGAQALEDMVVSLFEQEFTMPQLPQLPEITMPQVTAPQISAGVAPKQENLTLAGPKVESDMRVMTVLAQNSGILYLRGASYDHYTGTAWTSQTDGEAGYWPGNWQLENVGQVEISTALVHNIRYMPYYSAQSDYQDLRGGKLSNNGGAKVYTFAQSVLPVNYLLSDVGTGYAEDMDPYLQLPEETRAWARSVMEELFGTPNPPLSAGTVYAIAEYVRLSAKYDLNTPRMDSEYEDFAQWFLTESDRGYCVHFASATAVLLRAAGIPARYVTGYATYAEAGRAVTVTGKQAHAWVEFRLPDKVWCPLESTPANEAEDTPQPSLPQPTIPELTQPVITEPQQTLPQQTTKPDQPQTPTVDTTVPVTQPTEDPPEPGKGGEVLAWILGILGCIVLVIVQWRVRVALRKRRSRNGRSKKKALARWQEHVLLSRVLKQQPDKELLELAQRAKFSQHSITGEELDLFAKQIHHQQVQLKKKSFVFQLYYTLILALY